MSKFSTKAVDKTKTQNLAGGEAYIQSPKLEIVSHLVTSFVQDQFYRSEEDGLARVQQLVAIDPVFAAKAAVFARDRFNMRSISHVVAAEVTRHVKAEEWVKLFLASVIVRPDDASEILAYYKSTYGLPIPNAMKKGLGIGLQKFDAYQLAKYRGKGKSTGLVDVINVCRPVPTKAMDELMKGTLEAPDTWEVLLTQAGQGAKNEEEKETAKKRVWTMLLEERKLGYMALVRNLRNILGFEDEGLKKMALTSLMDVKMIKGSRMLPFRFLSAIKALENEPFMDGDVMRAIGSAVDTMLGNVPVLEGKTLVCLDVSGSMRGMYNSSGRQNMAPAEIGALFAAALIKTQPGSQFMSFDGSARYVALNPDDSTLTIAKSIPFPGGSTNFHSIFETTNKAYDRIIILSDMQGWVGYNSPDAAYHRYKAMNGADPYIYSFDLSGYGSMQFPERKVYALAGFSEQVFDIMVLLEQDKEALVNEVEGIEFPNTDKVEGKRKKKSRTKPSTRKEGRSDEMTKNQIKLLGAFAACRKKNGMTRKDAVADIRPKTKGQGSGSMVKGLVGKGYLEPTIVPDGDSPTGSSTYYRATPEGRKALKQAAKK